MPLSRHLIICACTALLSLQALDARAWFFFFIPGSVLGRIGDTVSGATGEHCVSAKAKEGDVMTSPAGNTAVIKKLSGTSSRCANPDLPIRAEMEFQFAFSSKAGIELPADFKPKEITSIQRFNGMLLNAVDESGQLQLVIHARPRRAGNDGGTLARDVAANMSKLVETPQISQEETLTINGVNAYRFRMTGVNKGIFGRSYTYIVTVLEGSAEYIVVNASYLTSTLPENVRVMTELAANVKGISPPDTREAASTSFQKPPVSEPTPPASSTLPDGVDKERLPPTTEAPIAHVPVSQPVSTVTSSGRTPLETTTVPQDDRLSEADLTEKLRALDRLLREGLITKADYEGQKQTLLRRYIK